jgi:glucosamine-6-phosphate deaminase
VSTPIEVVADEAAAGALVADLVLEVADRRAGPIVLGCPSGRTPRSTYEAVGALTSSGRLDPGRLRLVMMDEYVEPDATGEALGWRWIDRAAAHSCRRFADDEILPRLPGVDPGHVHFPDPRCPEAHEATIAELGGIDLFLLASGASDGHVAFNPPGSPVDSRTRVVALADATRHDNLSTFPSFGGLDEVPTHGVTVGLATIASARAAVLLLLGAHKGEALRRCAAGTIDLSWPSSIVHASPNPRIVVDHPAFLRSRLPPDDV